MDIIIGGRKSGKSSEVVEWLTVDSTRLVIYPTSTMANAFIAAHGKLKAQVKVKGFKVPAGVQVCYEEAQTYLPADATLITMTADGKLKAMTNYNVPTA